MTVADKPWAQPVADENVEAPVFSTEYAALSLDLSDENGSCAVVFSEDTLGKGDKELGKDLLKGCLGAMMSKRLFPNYIILLNSAVFLGQEDSVVLESLMALEKRGVSILISEESVDYYELRGKIRIGVLSSMEEILSALFGVDKVISL